MARMIFMQGMFLAGLVLLAVPASAKDTTVLKTEKEKVNYAIGVNIINVLKQQGVEIDLDLVLQGMKDAHGSGKTLLSDEELRKAVEQYHVAVRQKWAANQAKTALDNKQKGEAFLSENKKKEGVVTLESGLQYRVIKTGDGKKPSDEDTVVCQLKGKFLNGNEFENTILAKKPANLKVSGAIPGMREALKLMPVGSTWQLFIPSALAYGERGKSGSAIGPNAMLLYEVELLAVK